MVLLASGTSSDGMSRKAPATTAIRAADRGQARRDKITHRITSLPGDLLRHEMMRPRGDTSDEFLAGIVDEVFLPLVSPAG